MQGKLKTAVSAFGKLTLAWEADVMSISRILAAISELDSYILSIKKSFCLPFSNLQIGTLVDKFDDLESKLLFKLFVDREDLYRQLRLYRCAKF